MLSSRKYQRIYIIMFQLIVILPQSNPGITVGAGHACESTLLLKFTRASSCMH